ncbi:MAG: flagellin [Alphaproteobacteria bacterium]|nr:flagellin [Alphaproteobacteria bacterium]
MALVINTNIGALKALSAASSVVREMEISMERLSTGKRINSASDDAAGAAIASRLSAEIRGTNQSIRNAMDAQGLIETAEGAHIEIENILQRMRELAVQGANDTNSTSDRTNLAAEMTQLTTEINRIATTTTWAGIGLLNGTATANTTAGTGTSNLTRNFQIGTSGSANNTQMSISIAAMTATALGVGGSSGVATVASAVTSPTTANDFEMTATTSTGKLTFTKGTGTPVLTAGDAYAATINGVSVSLNLSATDVALADDNVTAIAALFKDAIEDTSGLNVSVSQAAGVLTITNPGSVSVTSASNARSSITSIDTALTTLSTQRATLGAYVNRLEATVNNLSNVATNLSAGHGRIEDADFATESTELARTQILSQASTAMLAQANASKQSVLSLLQG